MASTSTDQRYSLQITSVKNGGFRHYVKLPPQSVFQHVYWVLGSEIDVRIKRKRTFFNRETGWMRVPVYMALNKGMLVIYVNADSGYILQIPAAKKVNFVADKKPLKNASAPSFTYSAYLMLSYPFGEVQLRFTDEDDLRSWRTLLLAAHQSQEGLACIGRVVAQNLFRSNSMESVISTKSVAPTKDMKAEEVLFHRHHPEFIAVPDHRPTISEEAPLEEELSEVSSDDSNLQSTLQKQSPYIVTYPSTPSERHDTPDFDESEVESESRLDESDVESDYEVTYGKQGGEHLSHQSSNASLASLSQFACEHSTSEVDVSFKDLNLSNRSAASVGTPILKEHGVFNNDRGVSALRVIPEELPGIYVHESREMGDVTTPRVPPAQHVSPARFVPRRVSLPIEPLRSHFVPKKPSEIAGAVRHSKAMDFWKKMDTENNSVQPKSLNRAVSFQGVQGHTGGRVFNSPSKFYGSVEEAVGVKGTADKKFGNESRI